MSGDAAHTSPPTAHGQAAQVRALQAALAAENAAVFCYGVAGGHLTGPKLARARHYWDGHQAARDTISALVSARGATPVAAAVSYRMPFPVHNTRTAVALAAHVEDRIAAAYLGLVALTDTSLRRLGAHSVSSAAVRAAAWRGTTTAFPGLGTEPGSAAQHTLGGTPPA